MPTPKQPKGKGTPQSTAMNPMWEKDAAGPDGPDDYIDGIGDPTLGRAGPKGDDGYLQVGTTPDEPRAAAIAKDDDDAVDAAEGSTGSSDEHCEGFPPSGSEGGTPPEGSPAAAKKPPVVPLTYDVANDETIAAALARAAKRKDKGGKAPAPHNPAHDPADDEETYGGHVELSIHVKAQPKPAEVEAGDFDGIAQANDTYGLAGGGAEGEDFDEDPWADPAQMSPSGQIISKGRAGIEPQIYAAAGTTPGADHDTPPVDGKYRTRKEVDAERAAATQYAVPTRGRGRGQAVYEYAEAGAQGAGGPMLAPQFAPNSYGAHHPGMPAGETYATPAQLDGDSDGEDKAKPYAVFKAQDKDGGAAPGPGVSNPVYDSRITAADVWKAMNAYCTNDPRAVNALIKVCTGDTNMYATVDQIDEALYAIPAEQQLRIDIGKQFDQTPGLEVLNLYVLYCTFWQTWQESPQAAGQPANPFSDVVTQAELDALAENTGKALQGMGTSFDSVIAKCLWHCRDNYGLAAKIMAFIVNRYIRFEPAKANPQARPLPVAPGGVPIILDMNDKGDDQPKSWRATLCNRYTVLVVAVVGAVGAYVGVSQAGGGGAGSPDNSVAGPGLGGSNPGTTTLAIATSTLTTFLQTLAPTAATAPPTFAPVAAAAPTPPPIFSIAPTSPRAPTGSLAPTTLSPTGFNVTYSPTGVPTITPTHFPSFAPSGVPTFPPTSQPTTSTTITSTTPTTRTLTTITATNTTVTATSITTTTTGTVTSITTTLLSGGTTLRIDFTPAFNSLTGAQQDQLCRGLFGPPGFNQCNTAASAGSKCCNVNTGWGCSNTCNN